MDRLWGMRLGGYNGFGTVMVKTVHVLPESKGWVVKREGRKSSGVYDTQKEAIETARSIVRDSAPGQLVVHGRDGRIRDHVTYGMPKVQDPHGKNSVTIERAVGKVARCRLEGNSHSKRD